MTIGDSKRIEGRKVQVTAKAWLTTWSEPPFFRWKLLLATMPLIWVAWWFVEAPRSGSQGFELSINAFMLAGSSAFVILSSAWVLSRFYGPLIEEMPALRKRLASFETERAELLLIARKERAGRLQAERSLRSMQDQYHHAQKMEVLGRLTGGVAHDFNNMLSVISGYSRLLLSELEPGAPMHEEISEIAVAGDRAAMLTRQLLAFSRRQSAAPSVIEIDQTLQDMRKMVHRLVGEGISVSFLLNAKGSVHMDGGQITQVLMNLVVNGQDAMPNGGKLTIESRDLELTGESSEQELAPGRYVAFSVTDTGTGMDAATQVRIFEPFFTTKAPGKGTGLGLSTVFGIVEQSGGAVRVQSSIGRGTRIEIVLPRTDSVGSFEAAPECKRWTPSGSERVLLVEDDNQVRGVTAAMLRRRGYDVLEAATPDDALRICDQFLGEIHLLLTDVALPHLSGLDLAERMLRVRPCLKVLVMSGYCDSEIVRSEVKGRLAFLQKPLLPECVLAKVQDCLKASNQEW